MVPDAPSDRSATNPNRSKSDKIGRIIALLQSVAAKRGFGEVTSLRRRQEAGGPNRATPGFAVGEMPYRDDEVVVRVA